MSGKKSTERDRIQTAIKFDRKTWEALEGLMAHFDAPTKAELIRRALTLLSIAKRAEEEGGELAVIDKDGVNHKILH